MANQQPNKNEPEVKAKTVQVIINNREGMEIIQMPHRGRDIHKNIMMGEQVQLLPGLNLVDTSTLEIIKKNDIFSAKFSTVIPRSNVPEQNPEKAGKPVLVEGQVLPAERPLSVLKDDAAIALVEEANLIQLEKFSAEEAGSGRPALINAILQRIKKLSAETEEGTRAA